MAITLAVWTVHKVPLTDWTYTEVCHLVIGLIDRSWGSALHTSTNPCVAGVITPPTQWVWLTVFTGVKVRASSGRTLWFVCRPLHALSIDKRGYVSVGLHTFLLVTAPHTTGRSTVLTVGFKVAGGTTRCLIEVIKVVERISWTFVLFGVLDRFTAVGSPLTIRERITALTFMLFRAGLLCLIGTFSQIVSTIRTLRRQRKNKHQIKIQQPKSVKSMLKCATTDI